VDVGGSARVASAAAGLVGVCGYFGATLSSLGTGYFIDQYGWNGGLIFWMTCAGIGFLLCSMVWKQVSSVNFY
jgi:sugar phosphate permease